MVDFFNKKLTHVLTDYFCHLIFHDDHFKLLCHCFMMFRTLLVVANLCEIFSMVNFVQHTQ